MQLINGYIITWILHQIIMYNDKVKLTKITILSIYPHFLIPPLVLDEQIDQ